ncbi:hypothetical protein EV182_004238 [Spiromyces aspiralis]|uniref:Uncharacterized protein n=1 Tax=Spiromyces aspiralis TaxID=68401 RepID=A0ACC1HFE8_9FUNG|nr:hypothetical protein EV182_004238 [Spiromyces aspiralis]
MIKAATLILSAAAAAVSLVGMADADLRVVQPSKDVYVVANSTFPVLWDYDNGDKVPDRICIKITNKDGKPFPGTLAIACGLDVKDKKFEWSNVQDWVAPDWTLGIYDSDVSSSQSPNNDADKPLATSESFEIKPADTKEASNLKQSVDEKSSDKSASKDSESLLTSGAIPSINSPAAAMSAFAAVVAAGMFNSLY